MMNAHNIYKQYSSLTPLKPLKKAHYFYSKYTKTILKRIFTRNLNWFVKFYFVIFREKLCNNSIKKLKHENSLSAKFFDTIYLEAVMITR